MAYSTFTLEQLEAQFGVINRRKRLFPEVIPIAPGETVLRALRLVEELPVRSEKARSEVLVFPILSELRERHDRFFTIYSGEILTADQSVGLVGEVDFLLARDIGSFTINHPLLAVVEAKKHDLELGVPQCAAQMMGAKYFNQQKQQELEVIYGCVTSGNEWLFLRLGKELLVDTHVYHRNDIEELMGVFEIILTYYRDQLAQAA